MEHEEALEQELDAADAPDSVKHLRACIPCLLVKTQDQFYQDGCENCDVLEQFREEGAIDEFTTQYFDGMISIVEPLSRTEPRRSWVARWQRLDRMLPGCYAIKVNENVSSRVEEALTNAKFPNLGKLSREEN